MDMFRKYNKTLMCAAIGIMFSTSAQSATVTIDFDSLAAMTNSPGTNVPLSNQLSDQLLNTVGVSFRSEANYVAVVDHDSLPGCTLTICPTVSMPNIIGGVTAAGDLSYGTPIVISFFNPSNPTVRAVTDFVSIRGDQVPQAGATATMEAFDLLGTSLGTITAIDSTEGLTLSLSLTGIHSIRLTQNGSTIGFDNLTFNAVPVPAAVWLFGSGLIGLIGIARRKKS